MKTNPKSSYLSLYSRDRIDIVVSFIVTLTILALLIMPIYILSHLSRSTYNNKILGETIGVLLVSTMIFSIVLSLFTRAQRQEILASAAA